MKETVDITVVVENQAKADDLRAEHGLALWIEAAGTHLLFDTGQGAAISDNMWRLNIPIYECDAVVLSHGHYDHTGGLAWALQRAPRAAVYAHPAALEPRWARDGKGDKRLVGIPDASSETVRHHRSRLVETRTFTEITRGVWATGEIPRRHAFESEPHSPFFDSAGVEPDGFPDDQALVLKTPSGVVVLLGCAHAGVVNTLDYVAQYLKLSQFTAVVGGMHLINATEDRIAATADAFERYGVETLVPMHCTGDGAWAYFRERFGERCWEGHVGLWLSF